MPRTLLILIALFSFLLFSRASQAADLRHTLGGSPLNSFFTDDRGGSVHNGGSNLSYYLNLNDVDESAFGTLLLYTKGSGPAVVEDGLVDQDFVNGSGLAVYDLNTTLPGLSVDGEIGLADDSPLTPVSYEGNVSGLTVEQVTYTSKNPGDLFIIQEYRVVNTSGAPLQARLALANDFDVDQKSIDAKVGFVPSPIPFVYQQEAPPLDPNYTTVGVGLVGGSLAEYRLEVCSGPNGACNIFADDNDVIRKAFFEGASGQVGDLTQGIPNQDFAVTLAADLGTIPAGEGRTVAFCTQIAQGTDAGLGLTHLGQTTSACKTFYENNLNVCGNGLTNVGETCDDGDSDTTDSCPSGPSGSCRTSVCGDGFIWSTDGGAEECDDGPSNSNTVPDACRLNCLNPSCGDGVTDTGEQCDDGNANPNDNCKNDCTLNICGDGVVRFGVEVCDNGDDNGPGGCSLDCQSFDSCGNGTLELGEACDDGNHNTSDACPDGASGTCQPAFCGDGHTQTGVEECDDGNDVSGDGCDDSCQTEGGSGGPNPPAGPPPVCGNNLTEAGEQCDGGENCDPQCNLIPILQGGASQNPNGGFKGCAFHPENVGAMGFGLLLPLLALGALGVRRIRKA